MRTDPILIGAVGGSGTRVFARIACHAGIFMGNTLNVSEDSIPFVEFYDAWVPLYLKKQDQLSAHEMHAMKEHFDAALAHHLQGLPPQDMPWGAKNPRSLLLLPWWHQRFPDLRFIHVIRHGVDLACSTHHKEARLYRNMVFNDEEKRLPLRVRTALFWSRSNLRAAEYGEQFLRHQYLRVRFEDLCQEPVQVIRQIFTFLGVQDERRVTAAVADVRRPESIGRWRRSPIPLVCEAMRIAQPALSRFGYWDQAAWTQMARMATRPAWRRWLFERTGMRRLPAWQPASVA